MERRRLVNPRKKPVGQSRAHATTATVTTAGKTRVRRHPERRPSGGKNLLDVIKTWKENTPYSQKTAIEKSMATKRIFCKVDDKTTRSL
jgi:hypothetical protein